MPSLEHFRMMPDEDLLLHGKEAMTYIDEFVIALVQRFEDLLDLLAKAEALAESRLQDLGELQDEISRLDAHAYALERERDELERECNELRSEISNTHC